MYLSPAHVSLFGYPPHLGSSYCQLSSDQLFRPHSVGDSCMIFTFLSIATFILASSFSYRLFSSILIGVVIFLSHILFQFLFFFPHHLRFGFSIFQSICIIFFYLSAELSDFYSSRSPPLFILLPRFSLTTSCFDSFPFLSLSIALYPPE